ncbi:SYNERG-CTERM sorting domain-containing protein [Synergistaceae bacterium OttesenSCG-928-D05]|nr:SYNERG-CTERM sorting domain-containing protein [Synergistaceae bacterium OttesenSCG-928-D05]
MRFCSRKNFFLVLCALLICAFGASAGFAEQFVINLDDVTSKDHFDITNSNDVRITGSYIDNDGRKGDLVSGHAYEGKITLDAVKIQTGTYATKALFYFWSSSEKPSAIEFILSGDSTITTPRIALGFSEPYRTEHQYELIISGTGRLTATVSEPEGVSSHCIPAIGPFQSDEGWTDIAGSITIKGGYVVATGHNAPAIGDYTYSTSYSEINLGQKITISGGVIEAKTNSADIPAIGMRWNKNWQPTYIIGGSVSADKIADPRNGNEIELSRFDVDYGVANVGKSFTFTVNDDPAYDYTFTVPDDGIAWLWVPEANSGDIPPVPAVNVPKLSIVNWYGDVNLLLDMSGVTAEEYKWFRATSAAGPFEEIATTAVPNYTDKKANLVMGTEYWYYAEADGVRSDTKSITPQSGSSSGNCNAGFGLLALLGLLAPAGVILRKRG